MTHANAPLTPEGRRRLASAIVDAGWTIRRAAERFNCSPATASKWAKRYAGLVPRFPTAILAIGLGVLGALAWAVGLVLDGVLKARREASRLNYLQYTPPA